MIGLWKGSPAIYDENGKPVVVFWISPRNSRARAYSRAVRLAVELSRELRS